MAILVIDDVRIMDFECEYARNLDEAWNFLFRLPDGENLREWDEVYFDHDLGWGLNLQLPPLMENIDTRPIVRELENRARNPLVAFPLPKIGKCVVHSSNGYGAQWLMQGLRNAGYDVEYTNPPVIGHI